MVLTEDQIKSKPREELEAMLIDIYRSPLLPIYFSIKKQMDKLASEIEEADISLGSKDYDQFLKWGEKAPLISDGLTNILSKIDPAILRAEQDKRLKAEELSVESFVVKKK